MPKTKILQEGQSYTFRSYFEMPYEAEDILAEFDYTLITGLRHFLAPKGAENPSQQGKEVNGLKMPETLVTTRFMPIRSKSLTVARFEAIFGLVFV